jgi:hypothetical protein
MSDDLDEMLKEEEHQMQVLHVKYREKVQEGKLCDMKIKELKRSTKHQALRPIGHTYTSLDDTN